MAAKRGSDQSKRRTWNRAADDNSSYMFSVRIQEPLLTEFREWCDMHHESASDVMRRALRVYFDPKVRRVMRRRLERYEQKN